MPASGCFSSAPALLPIPKGLPMKTTKLLLSMILLLGLSAVVVQAQYNWANNGDNTVTITGYTGAGGAETISNSIAGMPVTSIGYEAF